MSKREINVNDSVQFSHNLTKTKRKRVEYESNEKTLVLPGRNDYRAKLEYANQIVDNLQDKFNKSTSNLCVLEYKYKQLKSVHEKTKNDLKETQVKVRALEDQLICQKINLDLSLSNEDKLKEELHIARLELQEQLKCPICLVNYKDMRLPCFPKTTSCGHVFCSDCIDPWLIRKKKCPSCRIGTQLKYSFRLYL